MRKRVIHQYSLDGEFIAEFESLRSAAEFIGASSHALSNVARLKKHNCSVKGYLWVYPNSDITIYDVISRYQTINKRRSEGIKQAYRENPEVRNNLVAAIKRTWANPLIRERRINAIRAVTQSEAHRSKLSRIQKVVQNRPSVKLANSEAQKRAWRRPGARSRRAKIHRQVQLRPEVQAKRKSTFLRNTGYTSPFQMPHVQEKWNRREMSRKCHATKKQNGTYGKSCVEDMFFNRLKEEFANVERQVMMNGWAIDFRIKDVYVQYDGVYYHGLDRPIELIRESMLKIDGVIARTYDRDRKQDMWFKKQGIKLVRVREGSEELGMMQIKEMVD